MKLDLAIFGNLTVNVLVSVACSWVVSHYYFKKETRAEKIATQIANGLQRALLPILHPQFFDPANSLVIYPVQKPPQNQDIPHVDLARLSCSSIHPNTKLEILLKLLDLGLDLDNPGGVEVRDHRGKAVGVVPVGLGYCISTIFIADDVPSGVNEITIELTDGGEHSRNGPNRRVETLQFTVT